VNALAPTLWAVFALAAAPSSPRVRAHGPVIVVLAPSQADPAVTEALSRFKGEAASVGFEVTVVAASATGNPSAQMESAAHAASAVASVAFVSGLGPRALDVWFTDRLTGQTALGHVAVGNETGDRLAAVLAVKAVDFLRARMLDFLAARPPPPAAAAAAPLPPAPVLVAPASPASVPPSPSTGDSFVTRRSGLSIGLVALRSLQGLGTTFAPLLRGAHDLTTWSSLRITVSGLGTSHRADTMGGAATFTEDIAMGEWVVMPGSARVRLMLCIGAGIHYVHAVGAAVAPNIASDKGRVVFAGSLSAGLGVSLTRRLALGVEAGSFLLFPEPQVVIAGLDGGRTGRPGLSAAVTTEARF
jgi:hypothetical protein